ncbi:MAG: tRNA (adenosine(37)-N6)-threonylcarbamoyltransferase complex ATPase subunit type 1 TsaE [Flavobacteriales bacterium]
MKIKTERISELKDVAFNIVKQAGKRRVIVFNGEMGAGKTTLIKEICVKLGVKENVTSPTFGIINTYLGRKGEVFHFDAYRIENEKEAFDVGIEEYLFSGNWCLIEWPDKIEAFLPNQKDILEVDIKVDSKSRTYKFD